MSAANEDYDSDMSRNDESAYITLGILGAVLFFLLYLYWCAGQCAKQNMRRLGVIILVGKRKEVDSESLRTNAEDPPVTEPPPHTLPKTQQVLPPAVSQLADKAYVTMHRSQTKGKQQTSLGNYKTQLVSPSHGFQNNA